MQLTTHEGDVSIPLTADVIERVVAGLTEVGEAFVVLGDGADTYVQAAGTVGEEFVVEYRDGGVGDHYQGDRRVSAADLTALLAEYLRRSPDWNAMITWHRVCVDQDPPSA